MTRDLETGPAGERALTPVRGSGGTRIALLAGLALLTVVEVQQLLIVPPSLLRTLLPLTALVLAGAIWAPWGTTRALLLAAPLLADARRTVALATLGLEPLAPVRAWAMSLPHFPFLIAAVAPAVLLWAWRRLLAGGPRTEALSRPTTHPPPLTIHVLAWLWGFVVAVSTVIGLAALNPVTSRLFWDTLAAESWSWPLASPLDSLHPLARGHEALFALLFFAMVHDQVRLPGRRAALARALVAGALIAAAVGVIQFFRPESLVSVNPTWARDRRVVGPLRDPNTFGTLLAAAFLLVWCSATRDGDDTVSRRLPRQAARAAALALLGAALLMTGSRVAWASALLVTLGWWGIRRLGIGRTGPTRGERPSADRPLTLVALACAWLLAILWPSQPAPEVAANPFYRRVLDTVHWVGGQSDTEMREGLAGRRHHWAVAWSMIRERPLWGQGLGTFLLLADRHQPPGEPQPRQNAHSQILQTWAESGLVGLSVLAAVVALALVWPVAGCGHGITATAARPALAAFVLTSLTGHPLVLPEMQLLFWTLIALACESAGGASEGLHAPRPVRPHMRTLVCAFVFLSGLIAATLAIKRGAAGPPVYGLYEIFSEDPLGVPMVWTRRHAVVPLQVERPLLMLPLRAGHPDAAESPVQVTARLGDHVLRQESLADNAWHLWVLDLAPWIGQTVALEIDTGRTWSPARLGSPDHRALGVALGPWEWLGPTLIPDPPTFRPWTLPPLP